MKGKRIICWLAVVLWMGLIFFFSAQPAEISGQQSGGLISFLLSKVYPNFELLTHAEQLETIELWQYAIRKLAHFLIYVVLGMLCLTALYQYKIKFRIRWLTAFALASFYAVFDEVHQSFVPGRSCVLRDMCIDGCGALVGVLLLLACIKIISVISEKSGA